MRYLWDEVRVLREYKEARMAEDAIIGQDWSPSAIAGLKRQIQSLERDVQSLRRDLNRLDQDDRAAQPDNFPSDGFASHVLTSFRLGMYGK